MRETVAASTDVSHLDGPRRTSVHDAPPAAIQEVTMSRTLRLVLSFAALAALAFGSVASATAGGPKVFDARMAGIPTGGLVLHGLTGGGVPWSLEEGRVMIFADGRLHVEVEGLVVAASGVNPIPTGRAVVTCSSVAAARSPDVPFSMAGDAEVNAIVDLPASCLAPAVFFVGITATGAERWFAVTGW